MSGVEQTLSHPELVSGSINDDEKTGIDRFRNKFGMTCGEGEPCRGDMRNIPPLPTGEGRGEGAKQAFTLAEVLITLGIIGVVAAMTMPTLMAKYDKKVATTRLKRFYTTYMQARMMAVNDYTEAALNDTSILNAGSNPEQMLEYYNKYFKPYIKTAKVEKTNVGIEAAFLDGSGMLMAKSGGIAGTTSTHVLYCINLKYCDKVKNNVRLYDLADRKNTFLFYVYWVPSEIYDYDEDGNINMTLVGSEYDRDDALRLCKKNSRNCTRLLQMDGWEFKDDYPW